MFVLEDLLNALIQLEIKGFNFYEKYKSESEDTKLKLLFEELALAEKNHEIFYKDVKEKTIHSETSAMEEEYINYIETLIKNNFFIVNNNFSASNVKEALDIAERLEKDTILFMNELNGIINEKGTFKIILEEEKRHLIRIYEYKKEHGIV
jgi:rubrerythrin